MDLLWQTIEYLMSHRDRRSWTVQELKNQTVLVIRFAPDIRNGGHLQSFQGADVEKAADLGTDFVPPGVTYKPKSQYQVRRDYKRSVGRFQKRDESQIVHVNSVTNVDIVRGLLPLMYQNVHYVSPPLQSKNQVQSKNQSQVQYKKNLDVKLVSRNPLLHQAMSSHPLLCQNQKRNTLPHQSHQAMSSSSHTLLCPGPRKSQHQRILKDPPANMYRMKSNNIWTRFKA